jgi:AcrR family transcriptional regulator
MTIRNGKKQGPASPPEVETPAAVGSDSVADTVVARRRRDEIISAATDVIATEGLHRLSLAKIEERIGMSRGQLTYYFPAKEEILLAVFDRMLERMIHEAIADAERSGVGKPGVGPVIDRVKHGLDRMMMGDGPDRSELLSLVHTFMAQVRHRDDYRQKLAAANAGWREHLATDIAASAGANPAVPAAVSASIVMALFQGLGGQLAVDPQAFDRAAVTRTCLRILTPLFDPRPDARGDT